MKWLNNKWGFRYWTSCIKGRSACTDTQTKRPSVWLEVYSCGHWESANKSAETGHYLHYLFRTFQIQLNMCQNGIPPLYTTPHTHFISSSADVPDILNEPACIPHILPSHKETAEERAWHATRSSAFSVQWMYLDVAEWELGLLCRLQPGFWLVLLPWGEGLKGELRWPQLSFLTWDVEALPSEGHQGYFCPPLAAASTAGWAQLTAQDPVGFFF